MSRYHYTECGLNKIYLANGFREIETPYGKAVSIEDVEGLHRAIGHELVSKEARLSGAEFRFLRKELNLSQKVIGELFGFEEQTISLWERKGHDENVPAYADRLIRIVYSECQDGKVEAMKMLKQLQQLDQDDQKEAVFEESEEGWHLAA